MHLGRDRPKTLRCNRCALRKRMQLCVGDRRMNCPKSGERAEAAIGASDNPVTADMSAKRSIRSATNSGCLQSWSRIDDAGNQDLVL